MTSPANPAPLSALDSDGNGIQVRFEWHRDRFRHFIERVQSGRITLLLCSRESGAEAEWPDSPPIQQLSVETIGQGLAALGVGCAGKGHWSISVAPTTLEQRPALMFDLAIRSSEISGWLGSTYKVCSAEHILQPLDEIAGTMLIPNSETLQIAPQSSEGKTRRWAYLIA